MSATPKTAVPLRALVISVAALAVPVASVFLMPDWTQGDQGMLIWLAALVPAFMLSYYRGLQGVAIALAGGMAVITATQVSIVTYEIADPNWNMLFAVVGVYLAISVGIGALSEALRRSNAAADVAAVDQLTGLPTSKAAESVLATEFADAVKGGGFALALFDIDSLKSVNAEHGHFEGDTVVQAFAEVLEQNTRGAGLVSRFGAHRFLAILPGSGVADAVAFANVVREGLGDRSFESGRHLASAGVAAFQPGMGSWQVMFAAADRALRSAKEAGRDRVVIVPDLPQSVHVSVNVPAPPESAVARSPGVVVVENRARVLIVDDDNQERRDAVSILRAHGFQTVDTNDPDLAIELAARGNTRLDVLVTTIMMPGMNGLEMAERISQLSPETRVVYLVGDLKGEVSWAGLPGATIGVVTKPLEESSLIGTVSEVAGRTPGGRPHLTLETPT
jgi:diguanylate cyclase (GGDEF)-like protein